MTTPSPSECNRGYIADCNCPIMLGKGFGPPDYQVLFEQWSMIQTSDEKQFTEPEIASMKLLLSRMSKCDRSLVREQILSGVIASTYQTVLPRIAKAAEAGLFIENQVNLRNRSMVCADIAITNAADETNVNIPTLHGILEVKWEWSDKEFPEMQGTRLAEMFASDKVGSLRLPWIPIYVLSQNHFSCGIAFFFYDTWAYSEIFTYRMQDLTSLENVLMMFRFTRFMLVSAQYHRDQARSAPLLPPRGLYSRRGLVDKHGIALFTALPKFVAPRVLVVTDTSDESGESFKVLKFYSDKSAAAYAVANRKLIDEALQLPLVDYPIIEGCGDGICAVQDKLVKQCSKVTIEHVKKLAEMVFILRSKGLVHGDLRLPNIIFHGDAEAYLIDCDWAGKVGACFFPSTAWAQAFGARASTYVVGDKEIPAEFDVTCLADIIQCFQDKDLEHFVLMEDHAEVEKALDSHKDNESALKSLRTAVIRQKYLDLGRIDSRIRAYLEKSEDVDDSEKSLNKRRKTSG